MAGRRRTVARTRTGRATRPSRPASPVDEPEPTVFSAAALAAAARSYAEERFAAARDPDYRMPTRWFVPAGAAIRELPLPDPPLGAEAALRRPAAWAMNITVRSEVQTLDGRTAFFDREIVEVIATSMSGDVLLEEATIVRSDELPPVLGPFARLD
jgi:hypothetical protein